MKTERSDVKTFVPLTNPIHHAGETWKWQVITAAVVAITPKIKKKVR